MKTTIRFTSFPRTAPPAAFIENVIEVFRIHEKEVGTLHLADALNSDGVLATLRGDLEEIGFIVEQGKHRKEKIERPVFYGENGVPELQYQIDAFHVDWHCGIEVEAGRAWMGNAIYRDLVQAMVMVDVEHLCLAVPNLYKFKSGGKLSSSPDYDNTRAVADALYGHTRVKVPYKLTLIGY